MISLTKHGKIVLLTVLVISLLSPCLVYGALAQSTTVSAQASTNQPKVGETLTVTLKISNAADLYGLDVTLSWNSSILKAVSATNTLGVESHSNGVLHESSSYPIAVEDDTISTGQYHLLATSTGSTTASFNGAGSIATVEFNVTGTGATGLMLDAELSVRSSSGEVSLVTPTTNVDSAIAVSEFPMTALVIGLIVAAAASIIFVTKVQKPKSNLIKYPNSI
jgi:hypothetical protein